jgi:hypothetical protein
MKYQKEKERINQNIKTNQNNLVEFIWPIISTYSSVFKDMYVKNIELMDNETAKFLDQQLGIDYLAVSKDFPGRSIFFSYRESYRSERVGVRESIVLRACNVYEGRDEIKNVEFTKYLNAFSFSNDTAMPPYYIQTCFDKLNKKLISATIFKTKEIIPFINQYRTGLIQNNIIDVVPIYKQQNYNYVYDKNKGRCLDGRFYKVLWKTMDEFNIPYVAIFEKEYKDTLIYVEEKRNGFII